MSSESQSTIALKPSLNLADIAADVLAEIFFICSVIDGPNPPQTLGWVNLAHVSRRWRQVLLELPCLWARIVCLFPCAFKELLARSRDAPLALDYRRCRSQTDVALLEALLPRAATLSDVGAAHSSDWNTLLPGKTLCAAQEADIGVCGSTMLTTQRRTALSDAPMHMPSLRRLTMRNLYLRASTPSLRALTLELNRAFPWGVTVCLTEILALLATAPLLEHVAIRGVVAPSTDDLLVPVPMLHLKSARLQGYCRLLARLWGSLDTAGADPVDVRFELLDNPCVVPFEALLGATHTHVAAAEEITLEHRASIFGKLLTFVLGGECAIVFPGANVPPPILAALAHAVAPRATVLRLHTEGSCYAPDAAAEALAPLRNVHTVHARGAPGSTLGAALREDVLPKLDVVVAEDMKPANRLALADALRGRGILLRRLVLRGEAGEGDDVPLQAVVSEFVDERV